MGNVFLISDTHFGHEKIYSFLNSDGSKVRPFSGAEEADELMVQRWNDRVKGGDKIYHLGDVAIPRKGLQLLERLNGRKILIKGNHDIFKPQDYLKWFKDIRAYHILDGMIVSHAPLHPSQLYRFGINVHGHMHSNKLEDSRYINICVEHTNYAPIALEDVRSQM